MGSPEKAAPSILVQESPEKAATPKAKGKTLPKNEPTNKKAKKEKDQQGAKLAEALKFKSKLLVTKSSAEALLTRCQTGGGSYEKFSHEKAWSWCSMCWW